MTSQLPTYRVLSPLQAFGDRNSDYSYEFDGHQSPNGYATSAQARDAMYRRVDRWERDNEVSE